MAHLIEFTTAKFDVSQETPNPINPIAGESVLKWLREKLAQHQYGATDPDTEDWGWYMEVKGPGCSYLVGAGGDATSSSARVEWIIQVHKQRSLKEKVTGTNKLAVDDPLFALIERIVREDTRLDAIEVTKNTWSGTRAEAPMQANCRFARQLDRLHPTSGWAVIQTESAAGG